MTTQNAPVSMYRRDEGLGIWEGRGKVVAVGVGHSPTERRWDQSPETSIGAYMIIALRNAISDAGVSPDQIDGLVIDPVTTTGAMWPAGRPIPESFAQAFHMTDNPIDGISAMSSDWLLKNIPELTNVKFTMYGPGCMSNTICVAAQAVASGLTETCLVLKGWDNLEGRYGQGGANAEDTISGGQKFTNPWGPTGPFQYSWLFNKYTEKYGGSHDLMANFVVNSKRNGLLFPEGFWAQHRPEALTSEDYIASRWIAKPANLYDCDIPITVAAAYLFTTPERAKDMKQKPVYILNHATTRPRNRGMIQTLDEVEGSVDSTGRKLYEGSGLTSSSLDIENMYDGYTLFHQYFLEGLQYRGVKHGEALDFYQTDISIEGPNPVSPSGGNTGSGRTRFWMHSDSIQQLQGRAGARQVHLKNGRPETAVSGGPLPTGGDFTMWGTSV